MPAPDRHRNETSLLVPALLSGGGIVLAVLAAYHNSFSVPFIYDDPPSITENLTIRQLWPPWAIWSPPLKAGVGGRPLVNLSFAINYALGGTEVRGYHALNLLIHALAGLTLFGVVRRTLLRLPEARGGRFGSPTLAGLAVALLWTVHPLQTEAVTYVSQRTESLMGLFYLLTLYGFIRGTEGTTPREMRSWYALSVAACLLGMACKEVMVSAPVMVLLYDRMFVGGTFRSAWRQRRGLYLGLAGAWLGLGVLMAGIHHRGVGFSFGVTWWAYALTECQGIIHYLGLSVWPHPLILDYGTGVVKHVREVAAPMLLLVVLAVGIMIGWRRRVPACFLGCWFFIVLAPASSVVPVVGAPLSEHRLYLPLAAAVALGVLGLHALIGRRSVIVCLALAAGMGWLTVLRNKDYRSEQAIWSDTVAKCPGNARAHHNLGVGLFKAGRTSEAIGQYEETLRIDPHRDDSLNNLAYALVQVGRVPEAILHYQEALRLKPENAEVYNNLGAALLKIGRLTEAIGYYEQAARLQPGLIEVHYNLGRALFQTGRVEEAIKHYAEAVRLQPDFPDGHYHFGNVLAQAGRMSEAKEQFEQALRLKPDDGFARENLAHVEALLQSARTEN